MANLKRSTGLRNAMLVTGSFKNRMDGCFMKIYGGPVPASSDDAIGAAVLLCTISNNSTATGLTFAAAAAGGVLSKTVAEVWSGNNVADGDATFYRMEKPGDTQGASTTEERVQGTVGVAGADLNLSNTTLVNGAPQAINYYTVAMPES